MPGTGLQSVRIGPHGRGIASSIGVTVRVIGGAAFVMQRSEGRIIILWRGAVDIGGAASALRQGVHATGTGCVDIQQGAEHGTADASIVDGLAGGFQVTAADGRGTLAIVPEPVGDGVT